MLGRGDCGRLGIGLEQDWKTLLAGDRGKSRDRSQHHGAAAAEAIQAAMASRLVHPYPLCAAMCRHCARES